MNRIAATIALVAALLIPDLVDAQTTVLGGTGKIRFRLGRYANFRLFDPTGIAQIDRATILVAYDSANVMDYTNDAWYLMAPIIMTGGIADTMAMALIDNTYPAVPAPPDVRVRHTVYAWHNDYYVMVKYSVTNYSSGTYNLHLGVGVIPYPSAAYGGETVQYDASKKIAYFFRTGETPYTGVVLMEQDPSSFHVLDWDVYSPTDPAGDAATDSTRWRMTALPGFDADLKPTGVNGSFFNLNAGLRSIAAGDSASFTVAYLSGTSLENLQTVRDSAESRFKRVFTSIEPVSQMVPENFMLLQNYPNPFNPTTNIEFRLSHAGPATLSVYDVLGRLVAVLVNENLTAGSYRVPFGGSQLASGIYYYRLVAGSFSETKRMLLVK